MNCTDAQRLSGATPMLAEHFRIDVDGSPIQMVLSLVIVEMTPTPYPRQLELRIQRLSDSRKHRVAEVDEPNDGKRVRNPFGFSRTLQRRYVHWCLVAYGDVDLAATQGPNASHLITSIETGGRLIQQEQWCIVDKAARDGKALSVVDCRQSTEHY